MRFEKSCGAIVFTKGKSEIKYLIVKEKHGTYGFAKGHVEQDENETQTALREVREETGLDVNIIDGFRIEDNYEFSHRGKKISKCVVYFLATYQDQTAVAQESEICKIYLMNFKTALATLQFEGQKNALTKANEFITENLDIKNTP